MYVPTGEDLRAARTSRGLTQADVADRAGVSQPLLSRIENGDVDPRISTLHQIVEAINETHSPFEPERLEVAVPAAIRQVRKDAGMTQAELADRAGVSQPLIARIEGKDVNPRASTLRTILAELDVPTTSSASEADATEPATDSDTDILASIEKSFAQLRE